MANVFLAAALLSGILAVSGCAGLIPGIGGYGYGGGGGYQSYGGGYQSYGGGYQSYGGGQSYPYDPGVGGGYAQPVQPYYQPQPYAYSGNTGVDGDQQAQTVPQASGGNSAAPPGRWGNRRQQRQQDGIQQGQDSGKLTPREARRLQNEQGRTRGAEGRMRADGNQSPQERGRLNGMQQRSSQGMQQRSSQDIYRQRHNGVQSGPAAQSRPTGPARPAAQLRPAGQPRAAVQPRAAAQPRSNGGRAARNDGGAP